MDSSTGFQGICSDTRLIEILDFHELEEVRGWADSHALRQGLFHRATFRALIREGSLFPSWTRVK